MSLDFVLGLWGVFNFFFYIIFCLKIDIFKFCGVLVCQENSRIFEKVAIIFFSQSSKWKNNFFFIFYFFELN